MTGAKNPENQQNGPTLWQSRTTELRQINGENGGFSPINAP
jgi:hypothetical protein